MLSDLKKAQAMGDHSNDPLMQKLQDEIAKLQSPSQQNGGGGADFGMAPGMGLGLAGLGMPGLGGGGLGMPGMGGANLPTMQATNPTPTQSAKLQNNWQAQQEKPDKTHYVVTDIQTPSTPYFLQAETIIPAALSRAIDTSNPGSASAIVTGNVYNDAPGHENEILIPAGAKVSGTYNNTVQFGQKRVQVVWKEIDLPDGRIVPIVGEGADVTGKNGLSDRVDNHYMKLFEGVMLMSIFDAGPMLATPSSSTSALNGGAVESTMGQSVGMNASSVGMEYTSNMLNLAPTITIRNSFPFNIVLPKTVVFNSYYSVLGDHK